MLLFLCMDNDKGLDLNLADSMSLDELLNNPEEKTVYEVPKDDKYLLRDLLEYTENHQMCMLTIVKLMIAIIELSIVNCSDAASIWKLFVLSITARRF